jgi:hypothetical protein
MEDAEITVLVLHLAMTARADFDRDLDVDQEDFGHLQACLTGPIMPQTDPNCADTLLDDDDHVDHHEVSMFLNCLTAPGRQADPYCSN